MNRILTSLFLTLFLFSCQEIPKRSVIKREISEELKSGVDVSSIFLNLKFGMSINKFNSYLITQVTSGKVKKAHEEYSYEFTKNKDLKGINWIITPKFHNDSLIGVNLHTFKFFWEVNNNSIDQTYNIVLEEYQNKYGEPTYSVGKVYNFWFKNNLQILITKSDAPLEGTVNIAYEDTRKLNEIDLVKCRFDKYGNSLDPWYYEQLQKEKKSKPNTDL
mgnify:FL=1|jgi:hypothetical protein